MQLFSADATIFLKKLKRKFLPLKTWKNCSQKLLIICPKLFFSIATRPKISPNLIFCSIKMVPCAVFYIKTLVSAHAHNFKCVKFLCPSSFEREHCVMKSFKFSAYELKRAQSFLNAMFLLLRTGKTSN